MLFFGGGETTLKRSDCCCCRIFVSGIWGMSFFLVLELRCLCSCKANWSPDATSCATANWEFALSKIFAAMKLKFYDIYVQLKLYAIVPRNVTIPDTSPRTGMCETKNTRRQLERPILRSWLVNHDQDIVSGSWSGRTNTICIAVTMPWSTDGMCHRRTATHLYREPDSWVFPSSTKHSCPRW